MNRMLRISKKQLQGLYEKRDNFEAANLSHDPVLLEHVLSENGIKPEDRAQTYEELIVKIHALELHLKVLKKAA